MNDKYPYLTIVTPVRNEERFIADTLQQLLNQDYPPDRYEIIVADGNSTDRTRDIVLELQKKYQQIKLLPNPGGLPSSGRNVGFKNGKGDYFLVVDGHCEIPNQFLFQEVSRAFEKSHADCLGRSQPFVISKEDGWQRAIALARTSKLGHSSNSFIHADEEGYVSPVSMGCAYSRTVFDKIGYVDESFDACEDVEFNYRVEKEGFKTFFTPKIAVNYYPRTNLKGLWIQLLRYGRGRAKFMAKHPESVNLDMFIPIIFAGGLIAGPFVGLIFKPLLYIYAVCILLYLMLISFESVRIAYRFKSLAFWRLIPVFFMIHFTLGFGEIIEFFRLLFWKKNKS